MFVVKVKVAFFIHSSDSRPDSGGSPASTFQSLHIYYLEVWALRYRLFIEENLESNFITYLGSLKYFLVNFIYEIFVE